MNQPTLIKLPKIFTALIWAFFMATTISLIYYYPNIPTWKLQGWLVINGFCLAMWAAVTFFSGIVHTYALRYMQGFRKYGNFFLYCFFFTLSVMLLVAANHVSLLIISWALMGLLMAQLIGSVPSWGEATAAAQLARKYFLSTTLILAAGVALLGYSTQQWTIEGIVHSMPESPTLLEILGISCLLLAAIIQSALFPFQRWLLSAMTAPTPASALMHAGFVNAAGILLTHFAPILFTHNMLTYLFIAGGISVVIAQFSKLLQTTVKQKLACSTIAQMGFMIMQCGLGFFSAALAHLILHGCYKAYLFLSAGEEVEKPTLKITQPLKTRLLQLPLIIASGLAGGYLFAQLTGKELALNSGLFLTFVVVLTVIHAVQTGLQQKALSTRHKLISIPILVIGSLAIYAGVYDGITQIMIDQPMVSQHVPLNGVHYIMAGVFLSTYILMEIQIYKKLPKLYVWLMNLTQPGAKTILAYKKTSL